MNPEAIERINTETRTCKCGNHYESEFLDWEVGTARRMYFAHQCGPCQEAADREEALKLEERRQLELQERRARAAAALQAATPPRYRQTDAAHRSFNARLWQALQRWQPTDDKPWLGMIGQTGTCKSRCAFLLLDRLVMTAAEKAIPSFQAITGYDFGALVLDQFNGDGSSARRSLAEVKRAQFLVIDEIGKVRGSPAVLAEFFALIDSRHAAGLATIWTSNTKPEAFAAAFPEEYAAPLAGRIVECSAVLTT